MKQTNVLFVFLVVYHMPPFFIVIPAIGDAFAG